MRNAIRDAVRGAMHSGMVGEAAIRPLFSAISVNAGQIGVEPINGSGSATFTRATVAHVRDFENIYRGVAANEARIQGARRVENLLTQSGDFEHADWTNTNITVTTGISDPDGGATAFTITADASSSQLQQGLAAYDETDFTFGYSLFIKRRTGSGNIQLYNGSTFTNLSITTSWQRFYVSLLQPNANNPFVIKIITSGDEVDIWHPQVEDVSGASNTAPSEYIATTTAAVAKYYTTTNGNSVASNVVTEAAGVSLHPTVSKKGANVLARYAARADSTAYVVGDKMIIATGSGPAGGDGFYYTCTTAGTSDSSPPTMDETIGNTTADNTVVWTNGGHYKLAGYLGEPVATNNAIYARDFTNAAWVKTNASAVLDATGIDGDVNAASTLTADAANGTISQTVTIALAAFNTSFFVKRKTGTGTIEITDNNGTNYTDITASLSTSEYLRFDINRTQANPVFGFRIVTSGDEIEVDFGTLEAGSVPSSPIGTTTVAVTRNKDGELEWPFTGNFNQAEGTCLFTLSPQVNEADVGVGSKSIVNVRTTAASVAYITGSGNTMTSTDNTSTVTLVGLDYSANDSIIVAIRWSTSANKLQVIVNGTAGTAKAYDGEFSAAGDFIKMFLALSFGAIASDIRIYSKDLGQTVCGDLTSAD